MNGANDDMDWLQETKADLGRVSDNLSSLAVSISGSLDEGQTRTLWFSYLLVEKSVAFIKLELDDESPGRFVQQKRYAVPDERQAIGFSLRHLQEAVRSLEANNLAASLRELRESRNYLRVMLKRVRRQRMKKLPEG